MVSTTEATIVGTFALFCPWNVHGRSARNRPSERPPSLESAGATAGGEVQPSAGRGRPRPPYRAPARPCSRSWPPAVVSEVLTATSGAAPRVAGSARSIVEVDS